MSLVSLCAALAGCAANDGGSPGGNSGGRAGSGGATSGESVELQFLRPEVRLAPRQQHEVVVQVTPAGAHTVTFALIDAGDAALDRGSVVTDTTGQGSVLLTASSAVTRFELRAQVGAVSATLSVQVSAGPTTTVEVVPVYTGRRSVKEWVASVHAKRSCQEFAPVPRDDSNHFARFAPDQTASIGEVELGPRLAVTLRSGQFVGGCSDVPEGSTSSSLRVQVNAIDRPIDLAATQLDVSLALDPQDPTMLQGLDVGLRAALAEFRGGASSDLSALLDAIDGELGRSSREPFRSARAGSDADSVLGAARARGYNRLSETITRWVTVGRSSLLSQRALEGRISAGPGGAASFTLERIGELSAPDLNADVTMTSWVADSSDTLAFGGIARWQQARLVTALARGLARAETGADDVGAALGRVAECAALGEAFAADVDSGLAAACGAACLAEACRAALTTMWQRAARLELPAKLNIAAAGRAEIGNQAQAIALDGDWVGKLEIDAAIGETRGALRGTAPRYSAR